MNIDLCYVPVTHVPETKLPAVSGSSGHLAVEQEPKVGAQPPVWPRQIFANETLEYSAAMVQYVSATRDRLVRQPERREIQVAEPLPWRRIQALQAERYAVRECRKQEDIDWRCAKDHWRQTCAERQILTKSEFAAAQGAWIERRSARRASVQQRQAEDQVWHAQIAQLRGQEQATTPQREWIAVLIITDNCTRQCLGLPAFTSGAHLSSQEMILRLREYLPPELACLISDQGTHFRAEVFTQFARDAEFVHVPIYRHRPQSNGIAERLVRTLKDWLRSATWESYTVWLALLGAFPVAYNDCPHQGLPIPELSPNEFANRVWVIVTC